MRRIFAIVVFGTASACASFFDSSGLTGGAEETSDAGSSDAAPADASMTTDATATADGSDSGGSPNLLTNGNFELGCAGWDVAYGFMSEATEAHGGAGSCKFCMDTNWEAFLEQKVGTSVEANHTYVLEVWMKPAIALAELDQAGFVGWNVRATSPYQGTTFTAGPKVTGDWLRATALLKPTAAANEIEGLVRLEQKGNPAAQGNIICVYVDDVVLRRLD